MSIKISRQRNYRFADVGAVDKFGVLCTQYPLELWKRVEICVCGADFEAAFENVIKKAVDK